MESFLIHYGIKGQKWGIRRFQNEDGTLTEEGKARYGQSEVDVTSEKKNVDGYEINRHKYTHEGRNDKQIDVFAKNNDYNSADTRYSRIGMLAVNAYKKGGKDAVKKLLVDYFKDIKFDCTINDEKNIKTNDSYVTYMLTVYGNNKAFRSYGEDSYVDDQEFVKR